jgi:Taurine catabolism dioxygenase TauD, TfdA family
VQRVSSNQGLTSSARASLDADGVLYVEGVEREDDLLVIAAELGQTIAPGVGMSAGMHDGKLYSVKVRDEGRGLRDEHGHVILSTTYRAFPLHTDAFNRPQPPRYVLLLRTDEGPDDVTPSHVSDARLALAGVPGDLAHMLLQPSFPSALGLVPLMQTAPRGASRLRFNREEILRWSERREVNPPMDDRAREAVDQLGDRLVAVQETFTIAPHDCLVLDNWRVCHGRGAMTPTSTRVLQRAWVI